MKKFIILYLIIGFVSISEAAPKKKAAKPSPGATEAPLMNTTTGTGASTKLEFEDNVVEGMSKSGADLAESMEKSDSADQGHLYKKKADFRPEIRESILEMGYQP